MPYVIITTTAARVDIQEAIDWENSRKAGLGSRFLNDLDAKFAIIATSPFSFTVRYSGVRCAGTSVFSYLIHYIINDADKQVIILRVLHTSRKPIW